MDLAANSVPYRYPVDRVVGGDLLVLLTITVMSGFSASLYSNFDLRDRLIDMGSSQVAVPTELSNTAAYLGVVFRGLILMGALGFMWQVRHSRSG